MMEFVVEQLQVWVSLFLFEAGRYLFGVLSVSLVLYGLLRRWSASRKIQEAVATRADKRRELLYSMQTVAVYASVLVFYVAAKQQGWVKLYGAGAGYSVWYTVLSLPLVLILHDTYFYWAHRAMHHRKLFRTFHRIHHLSRTPTPWAAYSFAAGEALVMVMFVPIVTLILPLHFNVLGAFLVIMIVRNAMGHSGIEFHPRGWVDGPLDCLTTTTHHEMHHQKFKGNYGLYFTWWDRWMGTELAGYKEEFHRVVDASQASADSTAA